MAYGRWTTGPGPGGAVAARPSVERAQLSKAKGGYPAGKRAGGEEQEEERLVHPYPLNLRSRWLPAGAWQLVRAAPLAQKFREDFPGAECVVPPEALWCWSEADYKVYGESGGYVRPKLKPNYYVSVECPQTIVDLVTPTLSGLNWNCVVKSSPSDPPPIFIWEGSRKTLDPAPTLAQHGLVNRVAQVFRITTKCGMLEAIQARCKALQVPFPPPWYPLAYRLPEELEAFKAHAQENPDKRWIYKPNGGARGIGIMLIQGVQDVDTPEEPFSSRCREMGPFNPHEPPLAQRYFAPSGIIQEYVQDLMLMGGRKFAVRVYVLIARVKPLLVYLHGASYAKVCGLPFDKSQFSQAELFRHVTNQEFQKKGGQAYENWKTIPVMTLAEVDETLAEERRSRGEASSEPWSVGFWRQVRQICIEVVEGVRGKLTEKGKLGTFEVLGLDFICEASGKVVFLEANRDPSWVVDGDTKRGIIPALVVEMLALVFSAHGETPVNLRAALEARRSKEGFHFEAIIDDSQGVAAA